MINPPVRLLEILSLRPSCSYFLSLSLKINKHFKKQSSTHSLTFSLVHHIIWPKCLLQQCHSGLQGSIQSCEFPKAEVPLENMALPLWASGTIELRRYYYSSALSLKSPALYWISLGASSPIYSFLYPELLFLLLFHLPFMFAQTFQLWKGLSGKGNVVTSYKISCSNCNPDFHFILSAISPHFLPV